MSVTPEKKVLAKTVFASFGGKPAVTKYWDDNNVSSIDILSAQDSQLQGITSFASIGLSDFSIGFTVEDTPLRVELVGACKSKQDFYANM